VQEELPLLLISSTAPENLRLFPRLLLKSSKSIFFMVLNETCVYLQELEKEGAIKESIVDGVIFYAAV